jgi:exo-beta-1,3-glucanase (GH17 family)
MPPPVMTPRQQLQSLVLTAAAFACGALAMYGAWWLYGRPQPLPPAPVEALTDGRFACLSYAPYRDGQTPFDTSFVVPPAQIEEDLTILAAHTACVRTYSTDQGLAEVVPIAARHGLKVMLGGWIGVEAAKNEREVASIIALANRYPDTVSAVIVGNEVLLRRDQTAERLQGYIRQVKAAVHVPVTYADVWEFWLRYPFLAADVDFVTVHMLPYWEDQPIAVPGALKHVAQVLKHVQDSFPGKKLFVGEIGWPSLGRMREDARPSPSDQTRFLREFVAMSNQMGVGYNFIEAFDQSWKRVSEGTVGGHWGLYDSNRKAKVELAGPVSDDPEWRTHWWVGAGLGVLVLFAGMYGRRRLPLPSGWTALAALFAAVAGAGLEGHAIYIAETALSPFDWIGAAAGLGLSAMAAAIAVRTVLERGDHGTITLRAPFEDVLDAIAARRFLASRSFLGASVEAAILIFALATALAILGDGRYRDFPTFVYLVPTLSFGLLWLSGDRVSRDGNRPAHLLAVALALAAVATVVNETPRNTQALAWAATAIGLALPRILDFVRTYRMRSRARVASPSTRPTEAGPAL